MEFKEILDLFPYRSESLTKYNESFLKAAQKFNSVEKNADGIVGGNTKYEYAKIDQIYKAVEKDLHENSLYITHQVIAISIDKEILITTIMHTSGEFMRDIRHLVSEKAGNQGRGGAQTYSRKYAVLCMCALATTDDDGHKEDKYLDSRITAEQVEEIKLWCRDENYSSLDEARICSKFGVKNLYFLLNKQYAEIKNYVDKENAKLGKEK